MYKQAIYSKTVKFYDDYWGTLSNWEIYVCGTFLDRNIQYHKTRYFSSGKYIISIKSK